MKIQEMLKKSLFQHKKQKKIKRIKTHVIKMENYKISKLLNDSTISKFVTKNGSK